MVGRREGPVGAGEDKQKVGFDSTMSRNQNPRSYAHFHGLTADNRRKHCDSRCLLELKLAKLGTTESRLTSHVSKEASGQHRHIPLSSTMVA